MKCSCGASDCASEVGFDSSCGLLIAEGNPGAAACGIYLSVDGAVILARQLRAFILAKLDEPQPSTLVIPERHK
jgi:hypothetical protein